MDVIVLQLKKNISILAYDKFLASLIRFKTFRTSVLLFVFSPKIYKQFKKWSNVWKMAALCKNCFKHLFITYSKHVKELSIMSWRLMWRLRKGIKKKWMLCNRPSKALLCLNECLLDLFHYKTRTRYVTCFLRLSLNR